MILLYGGGGEPGAGEIPMDLFRKQAPDVFPVRGVSWTNNAHEHSCLETDSYKYLAKKLSTQTPMDVHEVETAITQQTISSQGVSS